MENKEFKLKLNHSEDALHKAFGLSFYRKQVVCNAILFETIANQLLARDLFDDIKEAPLDMTTMTGILQKSMSHFTNINEIGFLMVIYGDMYQGINHSVLDILEGRKPTGMRGTTRIVTNLDDKIDGKDEDMSRIKKILGKLVDELKSKFDPIKSAIKFVKECDYDYDKFIAKVCPEDKCDEIERLDLDGKGGLNLDDLLGKLGFDNSPDEDDD